MGPIHEYLIWCILFVAFFASMFWAEKKDAQSDAKYTHPQRDRTDAPSFSLN